MSSQRFSPRLLGFLFAAACFCAGPTSSLGEVPASLRADIQASIDRGIAYLETVQNTEKGHWSDEKYPALTALPVAAIMRNPGRPAAEFPESAVRGYDFLLSNRRPDGGIYGKGLGTYNTALSLYALSYHPAARSHIADVLRAARRFLINQQADFDRRGETDSAFDGGIGYGGTYSHSDLSNTHLSLQGLYHSRQVLEDTPEGPGEFELDWDAAITFVSRCQNLEETNDQPYVEVTDQNRGGFVYFPGDSKAGETEVSETKVALRSYGSMSYAGLLSFIYAQMDSSDPRVQAALSWLGANYTLEENPYMDAQGLFYYYHTMAKALSIAGLETLPRPGNEPASWKRDLATKLLSLQNEDGSWVNHRSSRWWEDDPVLVTSYALLSLEHILEPGD